MLTPCCICIALWHLCIVSSVHVNEITLLRMLRTEHLPTLQFEWKPWLRLINTGSVSKEPGQKTRQRSFMKMPNVMQGSSYKASSGDGLSIESSVFSTRVNKIYSMAGWEISDCGMLIE